MIDFAAPLFIIINSEQIVKAVRHKDQRVEFSANGHLMLESASFCFRRHHRL